ncbi:MAG: hypothetical protein KC502_23755, partial [Myxococcales bacterium]|nr:hypothetical protein [Myxococcales bacterium]
LSAPKRLWQTPEAWLASLLWLLLLAALGHPLWRALTLAVRSPKRALLPVLAGLALLLLALQARLALPFIPLHANHHAWEDLAVVLNLDAAAPAVSRHLEMYGASWLVARRALLPVFGAHFVGVGLASAWWGATALVIGAMAALRAGGTRSAVVIGALVLTWAPVASRVAHSESDLVIAQWLIAVGLWLATERSRLAEVGFAAVLGLLTLGHVVGPPLALGLLLMGLALRPAKELPATDAPPARALPGPEAGLTLRLGTVGMWAGTWLAVTALRLASSGSHVGGRLSRTEQWLPLPLQPWKFSLWFDARHSATGFLVLAMMGIAAAFWVRFHQARWRGVATETMLLAGIGVLAATGLMVCASLTDGQRYQATLMAPLLVVAGRAPLLWRHGPSKWRWALGVLYGLVVLSCAVETGRGFSGRQLLDTQAQEWLHLQAAIGDRAGAIILLKPERRTGQAAVLDVPQGHWSATGPVTTALQAESARRDCSRGQPLPESTFSMHFAACASGSDTSCPTDLQKTGPPLAALPTRVMAPLVPRGLPGEFLTFNGPHASWRLYEARCPNHP